jgi:endonuclease I
MMKRFTLFLVGLLATITPFAQTNPTALNLPVSENFGTAVFTSPKPGMASWTGDGARPYATLADAAASNPGGDATITGSDPASGGSGGQYGHAPSGNGRLSILLSGNATNGSGQIAMAINTTGASTVTVAYKLVMTVSNARDFGIALQYRVGSSGAFTTVSGSDKIYNASSTNGGDADGPSDFDDYSYSLPAAAAGQPLVQLRWITWRPSGTGSSPAVGIDDIAVTSGAVSPCAEPTAQPTALNLTPSVNSIAGSFTAASPAANKYLVIRSAVNSLSATPVDGTTYTVGAAFGGGVVVANGANTSFSSSGLTQGTQYYFFIFAFNDQSCSGGPNYLTTAPLTGNTTTTVPAPCVTPVTPASSALTLTPAVSSVSCALPAGTPATTNYLLLYSTSATPTANPANGTVYTAGQTIGNATVVSYTPTGTPVQTGLTANTTYYFFLYAAAVQCNGEPFYSTAPLIKSTLTLSGTGIPAGYYNAAAGLTCANLKTALSTIITANAVQLTYTPGVWNAYNTTDKKRNDANTADVVWDMYSDNPTGPDPYTFTLVTNQCGNYSQEGDCFNREHSFPQSWFGSGVYPMYSDINHLFPTDGFVNNKRGNLPFGEVGSVVSYTSLNGSKVGACSFPGFSGTVFEPIDAYKGDFARAVLYMVTRYESQVAGWQNNGNANEVLSGNAYPSLDDWHIKLLYKWHIQDPVSQKEIDRNNAVYAIQANRNPFIDRPEYMYEIWSCTGLITPTAVIDPILTNQKIGVFPNPATKNITIRFDKAVNKAITVQLLDMTGRLVQTSVMNRGERLKEMGVSNLSNGTYFIKLINNTEVVTQSVVIAK